VGEVRVDIDAWDALVRPLGDHLLRSIARIVSQPEDAEDALQDALATIWRKLQRIRAHQNPRALIFRICADAAVDVLRRRRRFDRSKRPQLTSGNRPNPGGEAGNRLAAEETRAEVRRAIARLPRTQATAVVMRYVQEQDYRAIGDALGCREATARAHVARARKRLSSLLAHLLATAGEAIR